MEVLWVHRLGNMNVCERFMICGRVSETFHVGAKWLTDQTLPCIESPARLTIIYRNVGNLGNNTLVFVSPLWMTAVIGRSRSQECFLKYNPISQDNVCLSPLGEISSASDLEVPPHTFSPSQASVICIIISAVMCSSSFILSLPPPARHNKGPRAHKLVV